MEKEKSFEKKSGSYCSTKEKGIEDKDRASLQRDVCPYCGLRIEEPMEFLRHVFLFHST